MMETLRTLFQDYGAELVTAIGQHTVYVLVSVAIGFVVGLLAGILLSRIPLMILSFLRSADSPIYSCFIHLIRSLRPAAPPLCPAAVR